QAVANPAFIEASLACEFFAVEGAGSIHRPVETHAFAKMDQARNQRSRKVAEDRLRESSRLLDIDLILGGHDRNLPRQEFPAASLLRRLADFSTSPCCGLSDLIVRVSHPNGNMESFLCGDA